MNYNAHKNDVEKASREVGTDIRKESVGYLKSISIRLELNPSIKTEMEKLYQLE